MVQDIYENAGDGEWMHADCIGEIADIFARTFAAMGNCRSPLYITPLMAVEWFSSWKVINEQRLARNKWAFAETDPESSILKPSLALFRTIVKRNPDRARRRYLRACRRDKTADPGVREDGNILMGPPDDEPTPMGDRGNPLNLPAHFSFPLASHNPRLTVQVDVSISQRPGSLWTRSPTRSSTRGRKRMSRIWLRDYGIVEESGGQFRLAVRLGDRNNAIQPVAQGWPGYLRL